MLKNKKSDYETRFKEVDHNIIIDKLNIEIKAKKEAELNLPLEDADSLDVNEFTIKKFMLDSVKEANELVINKKTVYNNILFRMTEAISKSKEITYLPEKYKNECDHYIIQAKEEFSAEKKKFLSMKKDLNNFKLENKLDRQESSTKYPMFFYSFLIIIVIFESIMNATFFAKANELGLIGGFTQAFVVSLINVSMAFFVILLVRNRNRVNMSKFINNLHLIVITILVSSVFIFHLIIGHFRDALSINPENAYQIAVANFIANPFELMTFESWLLIGIGIILFLIFMYDINSLKDSYPGYTEISRRFEKEKEKLDSLKSNILNEIKENEENIEKELKLLGLNIKNIFNESRDIPNFKKDLESKYKEHLLHLENTYNLLIKRYRSINQSNRKTPKPKYFDRTELLDGYERIEFEIEDDNDKIMKLETVVENIPNIEAQVFKRIIEITSEIRQNSEFIDG